MSNSRKLRRQLQKSPYVQSQIRARMKTSIELEAKNRILFGEELILKAFDVYYAYNKNQTQRTNSNAENSTGSAKT